MGLSVREALKILAGPQHRCCYSNLHTGVPRGPPASITQSSHNREWGSPQGSVTPHQLNRFQKEQLFAARGAQVGAASLPPPAQTHPHTRQRHQGGKRQKNEDNSVSRTQDIAVNQRNNPAQLGNKTRTKQPQKGF